MLSVRVSVWRDLLETRCCHDSETEQLGCSVTQVGTNLRQNDEICSSSVFLFVVFLIQCLGSVRYVIVVDVNIV